jgi:hypothetical protein
MFTDGPPEGAEVAVALGAAAVYALCALVSVAAPALRWRGARGVERQQLRWFGFAGVVAVVTLVVTTLVDLSALGELPGVIGISAIPLGMAVAVLRYRLYDLDRLINRTAVYTVLTAILAVAYLGGVALLRGLLAPVTGESQLAVAGSTLAVAGVAAPLRARIQSAVDRRFNRRRYDARQTVEAFRSSLRDELDLDALTAELLSTVERTVDPASASLWLRSPGGRQAPGAPAGESLAR